jgi:hypothetical protein
MVVCTAASGSASQAALDRVARGDISEIVNRNQ